MFSLLQEVTHQQVPVEPYIWAYSFRRSYTLPEFCRNVMLPPRMIQRLQLIQHLMRTSSARQLAVTNTFSHNILYKYFPAIFPPLSYTCSMRKLKSSSIFCSSSRICKAISCRAFFCEAIKADASFLNRKV